jgi:hypothetical protein
MIHALAAAMALASPSPAPSLSPYDIVARAQTTWEARVVPRYVSFEIPCEDTFLSAQCTAREIVNFVVRMHDGRTYAQTAELPTRQLMCGGFIYGPALTPFGFFRRIGADNAPASLSTPATLPENLAEDPFGPRSIASVSVKDSAYAVTLAGVEDLDGASVYHLHLVPNYVPAQHPLRDLWVDARTFDVLALTYARKAESGAAEGSVHYRFAQVGDERIWTIVYIEATLPVKGSQSTANPHSALSKIGFPESWPAWSFVPGCGRSAS